MSALHQIRVIEEKAQLDEKLAKLDAFLGGEVFQTLPLEEQILLGKQFFFMSQYSETLQARIARF